MLRSTRSVTLSVVLLGACGDEGATSGAGGGGAGEPSASSADAGPGSTSAVGVGSGATGGGGGGGEGPSGPCSADALATPEVETTYFVAIGEPGADDAACDGLAPSDEGGGRCPFRTLGAPAIRALASGGSDVRVELRAGTYVLDTWSGLGLQGTGDADAPLVLSGRPGEEAILDVARPDGDGCTDESAPDVPGCVRQTVLASGRHVIVQGLTIQNGLGYHLEVRGGEDTTVRCNRFRETVPFSMRSDMVKLAPPASRVTIADNVFTRFRSQAIDVTGATDVVIERNDFSDPVDADAGAVGMKLASRRIVVRDNTIHDMGPDPAMHVFSMGGTGAAFDAPEGFLAAEIRVERNRVEGIAGILTQLVSCRDCAVVDNVVLGAGAGIRLSAEGTGDGQCLGREGGCLPTEGAEIAGNVFRGLDGGGRPEQANLFVGVDDVAQASGLVAGDNAWCAPAATDARFVWGGEVLDFPAWVEATGTDETSAALAENDPRCNPDP